MKPSRRVSPRTTLGSLRLATVVIGVVTTVSMFGALNPDPTTGLGALAVVVGLLIIGALLGTYARGGLVTTWDGPALAALLFLLGIGLHDPMAIAAACLGVVVAQSIYGGWVSALVRMLCVLPVVPLAVAFSESPHARRLDWYDGAVLSLVPLVPVFWGLIRSLKQSLERQEQAIAREALTASVASHLLGSNDLAQVSQVLRIAVADLCRITDPRMVVASVSTVRDERGGIVSARIGHLLGPVEQQPGLPVPADVLRPVERAQRLTFPELPDATAALVDAGLPRLAWFAQHVQVDTTRARGVDVILYGIPVRWWQRLPLIGHGPRTDWIEAIRILAMQTTMAEISVRMFKELEVRAERDDLTGLATRSVLFGQLERALAGGGRPALLLIDLDDFRLVNDSRGHLAADAIMVELAERLQQVVDGFGTAARFGGDEFAVLLPAATPAQAMEIAGRVRNRLAEPVSLADGAIVLATSIGAAAAENVEVPGEVRPTALLRCADVALHAAKTGGKGRIELYSAVLHGAQARIRRLEERLPRAMAEGEIVLYFQPVVDLLTGRPAGVEALARWHHPDEGVLEAGEFVPLADRTGQGGALAAHVVRTALTTMQGWAHLPGADRLWLSVNVSAREVSDPGFRDVLAGALAGSGLAPGRLVLEIPERDLLGGPQLRGLLASIAAGGVRIAIDDFAAEHASLAHLEAIGVGQLKIDHRQLRDRDPDRTATMMALIMSAATYLGLEIVAESLETDEHLQWAREAGVELAEGYLFAQPMAPHLLAAWLERSVHERVTADAVRASLQPPPQGGEVDAGLEAV